jgi:cytochrome oxidase Cu insertion factor (SCO1/SenC/PrrC family)
MKKFNWPLWLGFILTIFAFVSYPFLFANWETTRDFPWVNIPLFILAFVLLFVGVRRAFAPGRRLLSKIVAPIVVTISLLVLAMFIFTSFIASRWLPASANAPQVNQKAPDFTLKDTSNKAVSLTDLLTQPINNKPPKGVLLVYYRGYW